VLNIQATPAPRALEFIPAGIRRSAEGQSVLSARTGRNSPAATGGILPGLPGRTRQKPGESRSFTLALVVLCPELVGRPARVAGAPKPTRSQPDPERRTIMRKLVAAASTVLVSLGLTVFFQPPPAAGQPAPKPRERVSRKKKEGPRTICGRAYDLLSRSRAADSATGRPEERIRDWTGARPITTASRREVVQCRRRFPCPRVRAIAHDLARVVDHARNAALFDHRDSDLPPPPDGFGPNDSGERVRRDLEPRLRPDQRVRRARSAPRPGSI